MFEHRYMPLLMGAGAFKVDSLIRKLQLQKL